MRFASALLLVLLSGLTVSPAFALGGDVQENVTKQGFDPASADKACASAAKLLKTHVQANGWTILTKGDVPCSCKVEQAGWMCSITALVDKPDDSEIFAN
jgi:hypothetical protein